MLAILVIILIIILWGSIIIQTYTISKLEKQLDQAKEAYFDCHDKFMEIARAYKKDLEQWQEISHKYDDMMKCFVEGNK